MRGFFKVFAGVFAILFALATYVQNNDPDAFLWYLIYGSAALACVSFIFDQLDYRLAFLLALAYLIGVFVSWPTDFQGVSIGGGAIDNIEHAREALGLLINAFVMAVLGFRVKRDKN